MPTAGPGGPVTFITKLQLDAPTVTGKVLLPATVGVPVPVNKIVCAPKANVPLPVKVIPPTVGIETVYAPAVVTFTFSVTVLEAVKGVPTAYVPAITGVVQPGLPVNVYTAGLTTLITKLQVEAPTVTGIVLLPPTVGVPVPVKTMVWAPTARLPIPEKVIPPTAVVLIL